MRHECILGPPVDHYVDLPQRFDIVDVIRCLQVFFGHRLQLICDDLALPQSTLAAASLYFQNVFPYALLGYEELVTAVLSVPLMPWNRVKGTSDLIGTVRRRREPAKHDDSDGESNHVVETEKTEGPAIALLRSLVNRTTREPSTPEFGKTMRISDDNDSNRWIPKNCIQKACRAMTNTRKPFGSARQSLDAESNTQSKGLGYFRYAVHPWTLVALSIDLACRRTENLTSVRRILSVMEVVLELDQQQNALEKSVLAALAADTRVPLVTLTHGEVVKRAEKYPVPDFMDYWNFKEECLRFHEVVLRLIGFELPRPKFFSLFVEFLVASSPAQAEPSTPTQRPMPGNEVDMKAFDTFRSVLHTELPLLIPEELLVPATVVVAELSLVKTGGHPPSWYLYARIISEYVDDPVVDADLLLSVLSTYLESRGRSSKCQEDLFHLQYSRSKEIQTLTAMSTIKCLLMSSIIGAVLLIR